MGQTESLSGQYESDCITFSRLMKILWKENIWIKQYIVFYNFFCHTLVLENHINSKI